MTPQQVVGLAVRIFSIWLLTRGVYQLVLLGYLFQREPVLPSLTYALAPSAYLAAAALLWIFPMAIAHRLVPRTRYPDALRVPVRQAAVVACGVLGLWFIGQALPGIVRYLLLGTIDGQGFGALPRERHLEFIEAATGFAVGVVLLVKARWIAMRMLIVARASVSTS